MRIATFKIDGTKRPGLVLPEPQGAIIDLTKAAEHLTRDQTGAGSLPRDLMSLIEAWTDGVSGELENILARIPGDDSWQEVLLDRDRVKLCAPLERPGKLVCLAGNYREHIIESGYVAPQAFDIITQQLFLKPATSLNGDGDDILLGKNNVTVGWETELAVVIGRCGRNIEVHAAYDYIFGYTILNDISERRFNSQIENRRKRELDGFFDWLAGKWFDGFAPCGPWIVTKDEIPDPHNLEIRLNVNGHTRQQGNTRDMIFSIPQQIAYISSIMTLEPGDIISTGTPVGAGVGGDASLRDGDELVCEIEKIGTLKNRVRCAD